MAQGNSPAIWPMMTRVPQNPAGDNYVGQTSPVKFYENRYSTAGPQEWIFGPGDVFPWAITIYFLAPGGGSAWIEATDESPGDILGQYSTSVPLQQGITPVQGPGNIHRYPLTDNCTDWTRVVVQCCTAVRVVVNGGTVDVTVTC